jgi:hypothetical protein
VWYTWVIYHPLERAQRPSPTELTGIQLTLAAQAIEFEDQYGTVGRLRFSGEAVVYEGQPLLLRPTPVPPRPAEDQTHPRRAESQRQR